MGVASVLVVLSCCLFLCSARSLFLNLQKGNTPGRPLSQRTANPTLLRRNPPITNGQTLTGPNGQTAGRRTGGQFLPQNQLTNLRNRNTARLRGRSFQNLGVMSNLQNGRGINQGQLLPGQTLFDPRVAGGNGMVGPGGEFFGTGANQESFNQGFTDYSGVVNGNPPIGLYDPGTLNEYISQQQEMGLLPQSRFNTGDPPPLVPGQVVSDFRIPGGVGMVGKADGSDATIIGANGDIISKDGTDVTRKVPDYSPIISLGYGQNSGMTGPLPRGPVPRNIQAFASPARQIRPTKTSLQNVQNIRRNVKGTSVSGYRPGSSTAHVVASSRKINNAGRIYNAGRTNNGQRIPNAGRINRMNPMPRNRHSQMSEVTNVGSSARQRKIQSTRALMQVSRIAALKAKRGQSENVEQNIADLQRIFRGRVTPQEPTPTLKKRVGQIILDPRISGGAGIVAGADGSDATVVGVNGNIISVDGTDVSGLPHTP